MLQEDHSKIIDIVIAHVKPNSTIVTSHILYPFIKNLQGYSEVINIKTLMTFDPAQHEKSLKNIGNPKLYCISYIQLNGECSSAFISGMNWVELVVIPTIL